MSEEDTRSEARKRLALVVDDEALATVIAAEAHSLVTSLADMAETEAVVALGVFLHAHGYSDSAACAAKVAKARA